MLPGGGISFASRSLVIHEKEDEKKPLLEKILTG